MGGHAFDRATAADAPALHTPRLSQEEYAFVKETYLARVRKALPSAKVGVLIEAPGKKDYGDVDLLVAMLSTTKLDPRALGTEVGAIGVINHGSHKNYSLAVPRDGSSPGRPAVLYTISEAKKSGELVSSTPTAAEKTYAQVDIRIVEPELLEWYTFFSSYGDMIGLLGHMVTNLGLTVNDMGLWLKLDYPKDLQYVPISAAKEALLFLSRDPNTVMRFLALSPERYAAGFAELENLFEWLYECRLLHAETVKIKRDNSNERQREAKRPVFNQFWFDWLPKHMSVDVEMNEENAAIVKRLRQRHQSEAIAFFNKQAEFEAMESALLRKIENAHASNLLRPLIAKHTNMQGKKLAEMVKGFRRHVGFNSIGNPSVIDSPHSDVDSQLYMFLANDAEPKLKDKQGTDSWIAQHWMEIKEVLRRKEGEDPRTTAP